MPTPTGNINYFDPNMYLNFVTGLVTSWTSNTTLTVSAGFARDATNSSNIVLPENTVLDAATNGLNGLDTGSLANNTEYYVYAIGDSMGENTSGVLLSNDGGNNPVMPIGANGKAYDMLYMLDFVKTNGSAHFQNFVITGKGRQRVHYWYAPIGLTIPSSGAATSLTAIDLSGAVPFRNVEVSLKVNFTPATAGDYVTFTPGDATSIAGPSITGNVAAKISSGFITLPVGETEEAPQIQYANSAASGLTAAAVVSFEYCV